MIFFGASVRHSTEVAARFADAGYPGRARGRQDGCMGARPQDRSASSRARQPCFAISLWSTRASTFRRARPSCSGARPNRWPDISRCAAAQCARAPGKVATVVDLAGCFWEHGDPGQDRPWGHPRGRPQSRRRGTSPRETHISCGACGLLFARILTPLPRVRMGTPVQVCRGGGRPAAAARSVCSRGTADSRSREKQAERSRRARQHDLRLPQVRYHERASVRYSAGLRIQPGLGQTAVPPSGNHVTADAA